MSEPTRAEVDELKGLTVLEFGASWCPHCQGIQETMNAELGRYPQVKRIQVEDGRGKPLGRSFKVKLWPTLVFLRDGQAVSQLVRPEPAEIAKDFASLVS